MERLASLITDDTNRNELVIELAQQKLALDQHAIVGITDARGTIIYANDKFCKISGYLPEELIGKNHRILNSGLHSKDFFKGMYKTITSGDTWQGDIRNRTKHGTFYWVRTTIVPLKDLYGRITRYISIRTDITEQKETEQKLKHINRHLTEYVENANLCLHWISPEGNILWANKKELSLLGYTPEEYIGAQANKFHADKAVGKELLEKIREGTALSDFEMEWRAKDGTIKAVSINCSPYTEDGKHIYSRCFTQDITAKKQAENDLAMFFRTSPDLHCIADTNGFFKTINPAFTKTLGWSQKELLSRPFVEFVAPEDRNLTIVQADNMKKGILTDKFENQYICADGSRKTISWRTMLTEDGKWYATGRDVTVQKIAEENLRQSEEYLSTTLRTISEGVITIDAKYKIQRLSEAAEKLTGISQISAMGKPLNSLIKIINQETLKEEQIPLATIVVNGETFSNSNNAILIALNNTQTAVDISASPLNDSKGNRIGAVIVLRDVSQQRRQERTIRRQSELLNELRSVQDLFIKNPESNQAYEYILSVLLKFTQSEYGFVGEVLYDPENKPYLKTHAVTNIAWTDELKRFFEEHAAQGLEFKNLDTLFGHVMTSGKFVISNSPATDPRRGGLPHGHPALNAFLGLPIFSDEKMIGMIGAANRKDGYNESIIEEIQPLLVTYANLIEGRRARQSMRIAEQRVQEQNILLAQKQNLIQEVHHRVKNNLQIISSLLTLQQNQENSLELINQLQSSRTRIAAVALLHEILYRSESFEEIELANFLNELVQRLRESFGTSAAHISFKVDVPKELKLSQNQAGPLALIINELATNSLKHAFPNQQKGLISISVHTIRDVNSTQNDIIMDVADDGIGIDNSKNSNNSSQLGSKIIKRLATQLKGRLELQPIQQGTLWRLTFPQKLIAQ